MAEHRINVDEVEAENLVQIESTPRLKMILAEWQRRFKLARDMIDKEDTEAQCEE